MKKTILLIALAGFIFTSCEKKSEVNEGIDDSVVVTTDENGENVMNDDSNEMDEQNVQSTDNHNNNHEMTTQESWAGTYQGIIPCADCEGIDYQIMLHDDNTYMSSTTYLGKKENNKFSEQGTISWNADKTEFTTNPSKDGELSTNFKVKDNAVVMIKDNGSKVKGELADDYVLNKK